MLPFGVMVMLLPMAVGYPTYYGFVNPIVPSYNYRSVVWGEWIEWCI